MPVVELKLARAALVVVVAFALVHWLCRATPSLAADGGAPNVGAAIGGANSTSVSKVTPANLPALPPHVQETVELIVAAAQLGRFEELQAVIDRGANPPDVGAPAGTSALRLSMTIR